MVNNFEMWLRLGGVLSLIKRLKKVWCLYLCLKSPYRILLGKPFLQILIPSSTPLHLSWWITKKFSIRPAMQMFLMFQKYFQNCDAFESSRIKFTWSLGLIRNQAAHKVRVSAPQISHQLTQVLLWKCLSLVFHREEVHILH